MILLPIEMPSNCIDCPCHNDDRCYCQLLKNDKADWEMDIDFFNNRRENCPLIEMHTHKPISMTEEEIKEMREYLIKGNWELKGV